MLVKDMIEKLSKMNPESTICSIVWAVEDAQSVNPDLTIEECETVLEDVQHNHDAEYGINWNTLAFAADAVLNDRN